MHVQALSLIQSHLPYDLFVNQNYKNMITHSSINPFTHSSIGRLLRQSPMTLTTNDTSISIPQLTMVYSVRHISEFIFVFATVKTQ